MLLDLTAQQVAIISGAFQQSQIQYDDKYLLLYSAYNAWYRAVTGEQRDKYALRAVKLRDVVWSEYRRGECIESLRPIMRRIAVLTSFCPLRSNTVWSGTLEGPDDWEGLIEFWYAVRCDTVHANQAVLLGHYPVLVKLAYESLSVFMTEVVGRLKVSAALTLNVGEGLFDPVGAVGVPRLDEVDLYPRKLFMHLRQKLHRKSAFSSSKHFTS